MPNFQKKKKKTRVIRFSERFGQKKAANHTKEKKKGGKMLPLSLSLSPPPLIQFTRHTLALLLSLSLVSFSYSNRFVPVLERTSKKFFSKCEKERRGMMPTEVAAISSWAVSSAEPA
jgi:hypothetical protein